MEEYHDEKNGGQGKGGDVHMPFCTSPAGHRHKQKMTVSINRLPEKFTISLHSIYGELIIILYYKDMRDMKDMQCLPAVPRIAIKEDNE